MLRAVGITGRFHATDKSGLVIPPTKVREWTRVEVNDNEADVHGFCWPFPVGDTLFSVEASDTTFHRTDSKMRPTRFIWKLIRYKPDGSEDSTGRQQPAIVQPGTTTWGEVLMKTEYVSKDDGLFGWVVQHNAPIPVTVGSIVLAGINERAQFIHDLKGYSMGSNDKMCPQ